MQIENKLARHNEYNENKEDTRKPKGGLGDPFIHFSVIWLSPRGKYTIGISLQCPGETKTQEELCVADRHISEALPCLPTCLSPSSCCTRIPMRPPLAASS
uniref:Uncharacterized protein n=1 Tax=Minutocellus polymorphus TaxID=265543 RepID=A0A7S0FH11_9STRA|mmetsp:Transcript_10609/g.17605  ORF Transcript_10609/g.17605 Transcript_10609/m.17605 type:complete len:101 (+) Transcript_10609:168-470(+)